MKKLLKKLFYVDSPEKGAFLGIVLLLFGSWLVGTFFVFSVSGNMMMYNAVTGKFTPEGICLLAAPSAAVVLFILYFLFQQVHFWWGFRWNECGSSCKNSCASLVPAYFLAILDAAGERRPKTVPSSTVGISFF